MNRLSLLMFTLYAGCSALPALANPCSLTGHLPVQGPAAGGDGSGLGGTGHVEDGSGMGGTGHGDDGSGMGGTGSRAEAGSGMGGTGVVGVITGFASVCVNGLEIHYGPDTPVYADGQSTSPSQLAVGQLVSVAASGKGSQLQARSISTVSALVGPVSWVAPDGGSFMAMGQLVHHSAPDAQGRFPVKPGDRVRVSAVRDGQGTLHATRIEPATVRDKPSVSGPVTIGKGGVGRMAGLTVSGLPASLSSGTQVRASGDLRGGVLHVQNLEIAPQLAPLAASERIVLQGLTQQARTADRLSLGYAEVKLEDGVAPAPGNWVRVEARREASGDLSAVRVFVDRGPEIFRRPGAKNHGTPRFGQDLNKVSTGSEQDIPTRAPATGERFEAAQGEKAEKTENAQSVERIEKAEKSERVDKAEKTERAEKAERVEKVEKVEKVERPEKIEKPEKPERPEKIEKPEKPEKREK